MSILSKEELEGLIPNLRDPWLTAFLNAANSGAGRRLGDISDEGVEAEAKLIIVRAIRRAMNTKEWVKAESAGPFSVTYVTGGLGLFDAADKAELDSLTVSAVAALPRGRFPCPDDYSQLFARPRRLRGRRYG